MPVLTISITVEQDAMFPTDDVLLDVVSVVEAAALNAYAQVETDVTWSIGADFSVDDE